MSVHRISIRADRSGGAVAVDVALPRSTPVGDLIPTIVDMVDAHYPSDGTARAWRLDRLTGATLSESSSLSDNGIHDGDLLILVADDAPPLGLMGREPCQEVAACEPSGAGAGLSLAETTCVLIIGVAAVALAWVGVAADPMTSLIVAAVGAAAAGAAAYAAGYPTAHCMTAVLLCAATGFLTVPSGPAAPNVSRGAAAAVTAALLALRLRGQPSRALWATTTYSGLLAAVTVTTIPAALVGAALSSASLGLLALTPRLAVRVAGLGTGSDDVGARADTGHAVLTGLIAGCAAGTATGAALVSYADGMTPLGAVAFPALAGLILLLRVRIYADAAPRLALGVFGTVCGLTSFVALVLTHPDLAGWACGALIGIALVAGRSPRPPPGVSRLLDRLDYVALAAVIPMSLWVGGVYVLVGDVRLS